MEFLARHGCDRAQGYFIDHALPVRDFERGCNSAATSLRGTTNWSGWAATPPRERQEANLRCSNPPRLSTRGNPVPMLLANAEAAEKFWDSLPAATPSEMQRRLCDELAKGAEWDKLDINRFRALRALG